MTRRLGLACVLLCCTGGYADDITFELPGRQFTTDDYIVSTSVFHWFTASGGQLTGPWRPLEGRPAWTGQPDFWVRQIKDIMDANIRLMYVHLIPWEEQQRINLFRAMYELRRQGYDVPRAVPFLDPDITWHVKPPFPDLATAAGKDMWVAQYIRFFQQYFSQNTDSRAHEYLGIIDGRVMLDTWHVLDVVNANQLTRSDVESRLIAEFGSAHPLFANGVYQIVTPVGSWFSWADEAAYQFCTNSYLIEWTGSPQVRSYTVKGGYWDQNIRDPGSFLARSGGGHYVSAWQSIVNDTTPNRRAYIESWNEYDEGSGIYSADPGPPYIVPPNPNTDTWSGTNNPREYIDTTAAYAAQFNRLPARDAEFIGHTIPPTMHPGQTIAARIVVRNRGNTQWTAAGDYKLGQQGPTIDRWSFNDGPEGWTLARNTFGTSGNTTYENGQWGAGHGFAGGGLKTTTGNVDEADYYSGASTAWSLTFSPNRNMNVGIGFRWRLFVPASLESNEYGDARLEIDNTPVGLNGQSYLARFSGGSGQNRDTGWRETHIVYPLSGPGNHTIEIGGFNNRKTSADEFVDVFVDDVILVDADAASPFGAKRFTLDDSQDEIPLYGGIFPGRPKAFDVQLAAPLIPGDYELHFQMLQEGVAWFGQRLDVAIEVPPLAFAPDPPDGALGVSPAVVLSWTPGSGALGHHVYLGTDAEAVAGAGPESPEFAGTLPGAVTTFDPPGFLRQGQTHYWRIDELQHDGTSLDGAVWSFSVFVIPADFDGDTDIDLDDFGTLQACLSGSGLPYGPGCGAADLDRDSDVDLADFTAFTKCVTGSRRPAPPECIQ